MTFGTLDLGGNRLTLGTGSAGLPLPNTLTMDNVSSAIETKNVNLTLGQALSLTSGSITSTGGTLSFSDNLTLGTAGALDVTGSTLSVSGALDLSSGTFSSSDNISMLDLQAATTLSANNQVTGQNPVTFEDVHFNGNVLTLGSASTHLKVNDALALSGIGLETGAGSLTLSGALALTDNASLNSSGGTITLVSGASAPSGTSISLPGTTLVLQNALSLTGATLKTNGTTFTTNANTLLLSNSSILEVAGVQDLSGVLPDNSTILRLSANSTIDDNASLSVGTLDLANFTLTLDDNMSRLSVAQPVTLDNTGEKIVTGNADLSLNGGISATSGTLSSTGGIVSASNLSAGAAGIINFHWRNPGPSRRSNISKRSLIQYLKHHS